MIHPNSAQVGREKEEGAEGADRQMNEQETGERDRYKRQRSQGEDNQLARETQYLLPKVHRPCSRRGKLDRTHLKVLTSTGQGAGEGGIANL